MTTPPATALRGLVEAARALTDAVDRGESVGVLAAALTRTRAALAAWESRGPMADSDELVADVKHWGPPGTRDANARAILDAIDRALTGRGEP